MLPKTSTYVKSDGETNYMNFLIKDNEMIKKYNDNWNKFSNIITKELDSKNIYNKKILKTRVSSFGDEAADFRS